MNQEIQAIWVDLHEELYKFILRKVKDAETSKDILQEVFLKIQLNIHTLKDYKKLTSWVYQLTRNAVVDYFRQHHSFLTMEQIDFPEQETNDALFQGLSQCINSKINNLDDKYKEAILFTTFYNYSQLELAHHLEISYSGAKSRVQRAKEQLKELVLECNKVETDQTGKIIDYQSEFL